ncbi:hypothetical protein [Rhodoblastus sp.]|jgi:hypothetical protein|uniref:hypothetical protein n=1 Tax=Rhodoblastus sp. TaxID=1962975 RepID=UPI0025EA9D34|nr:hypothetical protein [Rhodoblastus sp.]
MISGDPIASTFPLGERPKVHPEMVAFYEQYIPFKLEGDQPRIAEALAALEARDVLRLEAILCWRENAEWQKRRDGGV